MKANRSKAIPLLLVFVVLSVFGASGQGQTQLPASTNLTASTGYFCVQRGPDSRIWQSATFATNSDGDVTTNYQSYNEIGTGICYLPGGSTNGQWVDSVEEVDPVAGGAEAVQGRHKVQWASDVNTPGGAVKIQEPDGQQLSCQVFGLAYYDLSSGSNAAIGRLQDSQGAILPPNEVIYENAFSNVTADILYTYTKAGLSQDVVLRQAPPAPNWYGLSDSTTILQVYTEFFNSPEPQATAVTNETTVDDVFLNFGAMTMTVGNTLFYDNRGAAIETGTVQKQWVHVNNRTFLIESVPYSSISNQIGQLHPASILNPQRGSIRRLAFLDSGQSRVNGGRKENALMKVAKIGARHSGLAVDYNLSGTSSNLTLQGDTTYLVSSTVNVTNLLTIEGGSVVKFTNLAQINVTGPASNIVCQTRPYSPSVWTSMNDNSVGVTIPGSTGTPLVATNTYLKFTLASTQHMTLRYLRFSYANTAISATVTHMVGTSDWIKLWDCQFYDCGTGCSMSDNNQSLTLYAYNVMFSRLTNAIASDSTNSVMSVQAVNVTADGIKNFTTEIYIGGVTAVNSLFTSVTNAPLTGNMTDCKSPTSGVIYQPTGAGGYYLTNGGTGKTYKGAGTTSIDAGLLEDLRTLTTYAPTVLPAGWLTSSTNLSPQALRDTDAPDIGYHYFPIDYAINATVSNATVIVLPGTVLACYGSYGVYLYLNGVFNCAGTAASPNYIVRYNTVQEQSNTNWEATWQDCLVTPGQADSSTAAASFTTWSVLASDGQIGYYASGVPCSATLQNCQMYSGVVSLSDQTLISTNCLYQRVSTTLTEIPAWSDAQTFYNNLFLNGSLTINRLLKNWQNV